MQPCFDAVARGHRPSPRAGTGLTGRIFSTADAASWGLVHMVAPAFELDDRATEVATALANANPAVVLAALMLGSKPLPLSSTLH